MGGILMYLVDDIDSVHTRSSPVKDREGNMPKSDCQAEEQTTLLTATGEDIFGADLCTLSKKSIK
jgi:hypothetical protein